MNSFPSITHIALTVRDLDVSVPWYTRLFDAEPVLDEETGAFRHVVWSLGDTLLGLHQCKRAPARPRPPCVRLPDRAILHTWQARLDELGVAHGDMVDDPYGSGLSFKDPDNLPLEIFAPAS